VDLGRPPERVLATHSPNQLAYFLRHGWSSMLTMATLPCPEQTKSLTLPANDRICFDHHQSASPFRPPAGQPSPKPTICGAQSWSFHGTLQHVQLMPKSHDFNLKGGAATKRASQEGKQRGQNGHRRERTLCSQATHYQPNPNLRDGQQAQGRSRISGYYDIVGGQVNASLFTSLKRAATEKQTTKFLSPYRPTYLS